MNISVPCSPIPLPSRNAPEITPPSLTLGALFTVICNIRISWSSAFLLKVRNENMLFFAGCESVWPPNPQRFQSSFSLSPDHDQQLYRTPGCHVLLLLQDISRNSRAHGSDPEDFEHRPGKFGSAAEESSHYSLPGAGLFLAMLDSVCDLFELGGF